MAEKDKGGGRWSQRRKVWWGSRESEANVCGVQTKIVKQGNRSGFNRLCFSFLCCSSSHLAFNRATAIYTHCWRPASLNNTPHTGACVHASYQTFMAQTFTQTIIWKTDGGSFWKIKRFQVFIYKNLKKGGLQWYLKTLKSIIWPRVCPSMSLPALLKKKKISSFYFARQVKLSRTALH